MRHTLYIKGLGYHVPTRSVDNHELAGMVDTSDAWIRSRTGIAARRIAAPEELCSDLAARAAAGAMAAAGAGPGAVTHVIVGTISGDAAFPSTACFVQRKLGIGRCMAFDISAACSGFVYGLKVAQGLAAVDPGAAILLAGAEVISRRVNWRDRSTCVLFGDGAGAALLSADPDPWPGKGPLALNAAVEGLLCEGDSQGDRTELLYCHDGGARAAPRRAGGREDGDLLHMNGREVYKHAVRAMSEVSLRLLEQLDLAPDAIDMVAPHQANLRIVHAVTDRLGLPRDKVFVNLTAYGNTSAASLPLALGEALEQGAIRPGMRVLLTTFGAGLTFGAAVLRIL